MHTEVISKTINISLQKLKNHLRNWDNSEEYNEELTDILSRAVDYCEKYVDTDIAQTQSVLTDYDIHTNEYRIFNKYITEIQGVTGITTNFQTLDNDYKVKKYSNYTSIVFDESQKLDEIKVTYKSGFAVIPPNLVSAILLKVGELYDVDRNNFTLSSLKKSEACEKILDDYKRLI